MLTEWRELCAIFLHDAREIACDSGKQKLYPSKSALAMLKGSAKIRNYARKNKLYP